MAYEAKDDLVRERQLKVQELCLDLSITGNATPASVVTSVSDPSILFLKTEGTDKITAALSPGEALPTYAAQVDANGTFAALVKVNEQVDKVHCAIIIRRDEAVAIDFAYLANTNGISAAGDKIALNCDTAKNLASANLNACLIVKYQTHQ